MAGNHRSAAAHLLTELKKKQKKEDKTAKASVYPCVCVWQAVHLCAPPPPSPPPPTQAGSVASHPSLLIRAAGLLAWFLAAVKTAPGKILSCKDQETLFALVSVCLCVYLCQDATQT